MAPPGVASNDNTPLVIYGEVKQVFLTISGLLCKLVWYEFLQILTECIGYKTGKLG